MDIVTLDNGLTCIFEKRQDSGVAAVQIWVKVGSKYEEPGIAGITHFIEHLIFKGTDKIKANEVAERIEALGGIINAYTSYDNTVYHIAIPTKSFEEGFDLLLESVVNPRFPEEEVEKERKVILEEIKMGEDDPQRKLFKELFSISYEGHPYGRPVIGYTDTVTGISREDIRTYFNDHYLPQNMVIVIVGDFDSKKVLQRIKKQNIGDGRPYNQIVKKEKIGVTLKSEEKVLRADVRESYIALSCPAPPVDHKDIPALEVLETILGGGDSSRLFEKLKNENGLVTNIATSLFAPKEEGIFIIYATFMGEDYKKILKGIEEELGRLLRDGIHDWELEKAKNIIRASYIYTEETVQGRARQIGNYQTLTGDARFIEKYLRMIEGVNEKAVMNVMKRYLAGKAMDVVVTLPKEKKNPLTIKLKNGFTCVLNRNTASPSFAFRIGFVGGLSEEPKGKNGLFNILSRMLVKGTKTKNAQAIAKEIDMLAGDISPFSGRNIFGLSGKFLKKDSDHVFTLLKELLSRSVMDDGEMKKVKQDVLSAIRLRDDDPISYTFRRFNEVVYAGHPYGLDPIGTAEDVESITVTELKKYYKNYITPANATLAISGDFNLKDLEAALEEIFQGWQGTIDHPLKKRTPGRLEKQRVTVERDIKQVHVIFGFLGPGLTSEDRYAAEVLDAILSGMGGRIHKAFREENPFAYATTFFNQMAYDAGTLGIYVGTDNRVVGKVEELARHVISEIVSSGFTEKEVEDAKNYLTGQHFIAMQTNGAKSTSICLDTIYGFTPGFFKIWPEKINRVKREDVNRVAKKYLAIERMVQLSVGKES